MKKRLLLLLTIGTIGIACQIYAEDRIQEEIEENDTPDVQNQF